MTNRAYPKSEKGVPEFLLNTGVIIFSKHLHKKLSLVMGLEITLTNCEIEYIIKVVNSLENRGIL